MYAYSSSPGEVVYGGTEEADPDGTDAPRLVEEGDVHVIETGVVL